jgi:multidrug efflux pump subunit AcrB
MTTDNSGNGEKKTPGFLIRNLWSAFLALLALSLVAGGVSLFLSAWPMLEHAEPLPTVIVEATYPTAGAQMLADTVMPIERQVNGVENMVFMRSQTTSDGRYRLTVRFARGTNPYMAQVMVQNRVSLAMPLLPAEVQNEGISIKIQSPRALLFVILSSPEGGHDVLSMSKYVDSWIKEDLARVRGVSAVVVAGQQEDQERIRLDPAKLEALHLTTGHVIRAFGEEQRPLGAGPLTLTVKRPGTDDVKPPLDMVLEKGAEGPLIRLKDVAQLVPVPTRPENGAWLGRRAAVALAVYPTPLVSRQEISDGVQALLPELRQRLPDGLDLQVAFPYAPVDRKYVRVDLAPAAASSADRAGVVEKCAARARHTPGIQEELTLYGPPFAPENQACILVQLAAGLEAKDILPELRSALEKEITPGSVRLCDVSSSPRFPLGGYAIDLAVVEAAADSPERRRLADKLAERLRQSGKFTDVASSPSTRHLEMNINSAAARGARVLEWDLFEEVRIRMGSISVNRLGRTWQMCMEPGIGATSTSADLQKITIRNMEGQKVPLDRLLSVRAVDSPLIVERVNLYPALGITANPVPGMALTEARALCESLAEDIRRELGLSAHCRLIWVQE